MIKILNSITSPRSSKPATDIFYAEESLNIADCTISVPGMENLSLPIGPSDLQTLFNLSSKAQFGLREKTLLDTKVRNSNEISADQLTISFHQNSLEKMLNRMKVQMKLPEESKLEAKLHNMLIYGPGQFFKQHQDSEKIEGMIATLVMILPCAHIGGNLVLKHNKSKHSFVSENLQNKDIECIIFYADCQHEVKKIREGHRIALTFNVALDNPQKIIHNNINDNLKNELANYFSGMGDSGNAHSNFAYILEHEYTTHSLKWNLLKGNDHINASSFLYAAQQLDLVPHLALIEIYQSWSAYDMHGDDVPELQEIITEEQILSDWVDVDNNKLSYREYDIDTQNTCYSTALSDLEASDSEYEGWMGNYGNTMDYWYKKAAIILWPRDIDIKMTFDLDRDNQIKKLVELTAHPGNEKQVQDIIQQAHHYILYNGYNQDLQNESNLHLFKIAIYVNDPALALYLLSKFAIFEIQEEHLDSMIRLQSKYGVKWCIQLMAEWQSNLHPRQSELIQNLDSVVQILLDKKADIKLIDLLLKYQLKSIQQQDQLIKSYKAIDIRKSQLQRMLEAQNMFNIYIRLYQDAETAEEFVSYLIDNPVLYPILELFQMIEPLHNSISKPYYNFYSRLINYIINTMDEKLALGPPREADWSIEVSLRCNCTDCNTVTNFLISNDIQQIFAVVMKVRNHIMDQLQGMCLPITIEVVKKGSPHKLILTKTPKMHQEAMLYFNKLQAERKKLPITHNL